MAKQNKPSNSGNNNSGNSNSRNSGINTNIDRRGAENTKGSGTGNRPSPKKGEN